MAAPGFSVELWVVGLGFVDVWLSEAVGVGLLLAVGLMLGEEVGMGVARQAGVLCCLCLQFLLLKECCSNRLRTVRRRLRLTGNFGLHSVCRR